MKITITTSVKNIEAANVALGRGIEAIKAGVFGVGMLTDQELKDAETFRQSLIKAFLNPHTADDKENL